jgi:hypothetical protein
MNFELSGSPSLATSILIKKNKNKTWKNSLSIPHISFLPPKLRKIFSEVFLVQIWGKQFQSLYSRQKSLKNVFQNFNSSVLEKKHREWEENCSKTWDYNASPIRIFLKSP